MIKKGDIIMCSGYYGLVLYRRQDYVYFILQDHNGQKRVRFTTINLNKKCYCSKYNISEKSLYASNIRNIKLQFEFNCTKVDKKLVPIEVVNYFKSLGDNNMPFKVLMRL